MRPRKPIHRRVQPLQPLHPRLQLQRQKLRVGATGAGSFMKRLYVDEDFLTAVGGFDEAESAVVVPGFEGSAEMHGREICGGERLR